MTDKKEPFCELNDLEQIYRRLNDYDFITQKRMIEWLNSRIQSNESQRMDRARLKIPMPKEKQEFEE